MARKFGDLSAEDAIKQTPYRSGTAVEGGFRSALANLRAGELAYRITLAQQAAYEKHGPSMYVDNPLDDVDSSGQPVELGPEASTNTYVQMLEAERQRQQAFAAGVAPRVQRAEDIRSLGDAANYVGGVVGAVPVTMAPVIGAAVAGRVGGKLLAPAAGRVSPALASALPTVGSSAAAYATSYDMLADENLNAQLNDPVAATRSADDRMRNARPAAMGGAILDAVLPVGLAGGARKLGMSGGNAALGVFAGAGVEGATETAQLGLQNMQLRNLGGTTMQDSGLDYLNAGVAGAIGGGTMSGAAAGVGYAANKFAKPVTPIEQSLSQEIDAAQQPEGGGGKAPSVQPAVDRDLAMEQLMDDQVAAENLDPSTGVEAQPQKTMFEEEFRTEGEKAQPGYAGDQQATEAKNEFSIAGVDDIVANGGGALEVLNKKTGKAVPFKNFAVVLDEGGFAEVVQVERDARDTSKENKGAGIEAYRQLGEELARRGVTLSSSNALKADGKKLWDVLVEEGRAERTPGGYRFIPQESQATVEAAQQESQDDPVLSSLREELTFAGAEGRFDDVVEIQEQIDAHQARRAAQQEIVPDAEWASEWEKAQPGYAGDQQEATEERSAIEEANPTAVADEAAQVLTGAVEPDAERLASDPIGYEQEQSVREQSAAQTMLAELKSGSLKSGTTPAIRARIKQLENAEQLDDASIAEIVSLYNQTVQPTKLADTVQRLKEGGTVADARLEGDEKHSFADAKLPRNTAPLRREIEVELISSGLVTDPKQAREVARNIMLLDTLSAQSDKEINAVQYAAMIEGREVIKQFDKNGKITKTLAAAREVEAQRLAEGKEPHASSIVSATRDTESARDPDLFNRFTALTDMDSKLSDGRWEESVMMQIMPAEARSRMLGINDNAPDNVKLDGVASPILHIATQIDIANDPAISEAQREEARGKLLSFYKDKARVDLVLNAYKDLRSAGTKIDPRQIDEERSILAEEMAGNNTVAPLNNEDYTLPDDREGETDGAWMDNEKLDAQKDLRPVEYMGTGKHNAPFPPSAATRETAEDREWVGLADHLERSASDLDHKEALGEAIKSVRSEVNQVIGDRVKSEWNTGAIKQIRSELGLTGGHADGDNLAQVSNALRTKYSAVRAALNEVQRLKEAADVAKADDELSPAMKDLAMQEYRTARAEAIRTHGEQMVRDTLAGQVRFSDKRFSAELGKALDDFTNYPSWVFDDETAATIAGADPATVRKSLNELKVNAAKNEDGGLNFTRQEVLKLAEARDVDGNADVQEQRGQRLFKVKDDNGKVHTFDTRRVARAMLKKLQQNGAYTTKGMGWTQKTVDALIQGLGSIKLAPGFSKAFSGKDADVARRIAQLSLAQLNPKFFPEAHDLKVGDVAKTFGMSPALYKQTRTQLEEAILTGKFPTLDAKAFDKELNKRMVAASRMGAEEGAGIIRVPGEESVAGKVDRQAVRARAEKMGVVEEDVVIEPDALEQPVKSQEEQLLDEDRKEQREIASGKKPNRDLTGAPITYTDKALPYYRAVVDPTARFEYVPPIKEAIAEVVEDAETPPVRGRATLAKGRDVKAEILEGGITEMGVLTNHSGGAKGADTAWDTIGREFGVVNHNHYREPANARQKGSQAGQVDSKELTAAGVSSVDIDQDLYDAGVDRATVASRQLGRIEASHTARSPYTIRNWAQVKNADAIFAVGQIIPAGTEMRHGKKALREQVSGGTGVAVQMAINARKPVYVFDQVQGGWFAWDGKTFVPTKTPVLTKNFAGVGTREITPAGRKGIRDAYALTQRAIEKAHAEPEGKPGAKSNGGAKATARKPSINARQKAFIEQTNEGLLTGQVIEDPVSLVENLVDVFTQLAQAGHLDGNRTSAAKKAAHVWVELLDPKSVFHIGRRALAAGIITTPQYEAILEKTGHAVDKHEGHTFVGKSTPGFADDFKKAMKMMSKDKTMSEQELFEQTGWFRDARGEWRKDVNTVGEYTALGANLMQMEMNGETTRNLGKMLNGQGAGRALRTHMDKVTVSMPSTWSLDTPNTFDEAAGVIHVNPVRQILHAARRDQMFKLGDKVISYRELKLLFGKENAKGELVLASKDEVSKRFADKFPDVGGALETALNDAAAASALEGVQRIVQQLSYAEQQVNNWTGAAIDYLGGDKEAQKLAAKIADPKATLEERGAARLALLEQVAQTVGATIYNEDGSVNTEKRDFVSDIIAQQMAKDPREREIRNMLDSRFGTTYPKGSKLSEMEAALTDEQRAVRDQMTAELTRMIGTQISQQFDILDDDSEHGRGAFVEYRALDGSSVLKVLRFAAATQSGDIHVARHESVHAFLSMLKGRAKQQVWRDLRRAIVESSRVRAEVVRYYKDQKAVLDQLDPRKNPDYEEELMAYAFQLYVDGKLNLNPKSRNFFNKVVAFVANVLGLATQEQRAAALFDALFAGELNPTDPEKGGYGGRNIANKMRELNKRGRPTETFRNKLERTAPGVARMVDTLFATPTEVLRNSGSKALTELAEMFAPHMASAKNGGLIANRGQRAAQFHNRWSKLVGKFEKAEISQALADAQAMREPTTAAGREVREFLSDMYKYSNEAGVKRWDPKLRQYKDIVEMQNYFPRVWEHGYISQHEDEFKTLIKKYSKMSEDDIDALLREIAENDGRIEILTEKAGLDAGFTPFQSSISQRGFTFIDESNAHEFAKFQSQDINDIMAGYIEQAVHRAEYTRLFGNRGEVIDKLIQRAAVEDGISPEEIIQTYRYHIDALSGTLGAHSMGRGLRLAQAAAITAQNIILLPFAIFSQAIDGLGSSVRSGNIRDAKNAYGQVLKDMTRFALRDKSYDYAQDVAEMLGVVSQEAAVHAVNNAGMFMMNKGLRNVNRHFFRWNGMSGWNDSMRKAAMITGIQFLEQHTGLKGGKVDERRFEELGLTLEEAKDMVVRFREGEKRGVAPEFSTTQAQAMYRFVDQAVIRPNASMRASWLSDPRWMIFAHLKQFTYGMHKVTIARALHEADNDNAASLAILAGYAPMALAADMTKWALLGMNVTENWDTWDYMKHAVSRGGLLGLWEFGTNVAGDAGSGRIPGSSLVGPTVEHGMTVARSLNVGVDKPVDWDRIVGRSVPGYKYVSSD